MSIYEIIMLVCFGISWPVSIYKTMKTRVVTGKSPLFMVIVIVGYFFGILNKAIFSCDWVILLYALNLLLVTIDLALYYRFSRLPNPKS